MSVLIEMIRKAVVMVLLMELVLQLQPGKQYEPYLKMFVGILMAYSLLHGVVGVFGKVNGIADNKILDFQWVDNGLFEVFNEYGTTLGTEETTERDNQRIDIQVPKVTVEKIEIERVGSKP